MAQLTRSYVLAKTKKSDLRDVKNLNIWGSDLQDVSILREMPNVEVLSLSVNAISSLADFAQCHSLTELYLRKNKISDLREVVYLRGLRNLSVLWLCDNPIASDPQYRSYLIRALPQLKRLDDADITPAELQEASRTRFTIPIELPSSGGARYAPQQVPQKRGGWDEPAQPKSTPSKGSSAGAVGMPSYASQNVVHAVLTLLKDMNLEQLETVKMSVNNLIAGKK
ncbi:Leucine rich repeat protein [Giardia muris]|uniref:Leucine rich repeat protein n=1 Tax=Giardia muris TaxID=5742 RepID=A0A4Z1T2E3_GIAMU|nr:Leucine rich repeat protein [Giardia muris]|eukprot:TNJ28103.1 Leucine rich repeat protein [Giardia muris]